MSVTSYQSYCVATYRSYDDKADFQKKALGIAVGLTVGSWTDLPEARKTEMEKHLGQVVDVSIHEPAGVGPGERYADIRIAYPDVNFSRDIPALLVTVFGKLSMDGRIKLIDLSFSDGFLSAFPGPRFGLSGVRELLGVHERPLLMSIFKSVIGHDLSALREQFYQQALGGVDLIKDDEILFENPLTPIERRVEACMQAAAQAGSETGQKLLYAANLTGPTFGLVEQAKRAIGAGANALLFNVLAYGFDALSELSRHPDVSVPIMAHPALAGAYYPSAYHGISANVLLGKLMRLAGADLVLFPSPYGSVVMPLEENMAIKDALLTKQAADYSLGASAEQPLGLATSFPVPSAGIHPGLVPWILRDFGRDVVVNAGGGVHGHPQGAAAGGRAFRQAIEACLIGSPLRAYAADGHPELQAAIEAWGAKE
ncbi:2,3-diketo-5-methylthiopentyl-1-phosphate enolase [Paenibacillus puerhi]|uniref:2,3-diketo-5-methylthiopentyl-1-phosphate enolase n=1 Tax=Paenibacillus puerhi TaxID=2692622 RepID=UPI0013585965|nr:2,3-diketo-5-methylthiopentyl-1-phosphate enolase [Paenibacillus puerhi]